jgi:hypothetical protein
MATTADERTSKQAHSTTVSLSNQKQFWEASRKIQPDSALAGYWDALQKNCDQWAVELSVAPFWKAVKERQPTWSNDFQRKTSGALLAKLRKQIFVVLQRIKPLRTLRSSSPKPEDSVNNFWNSIIHL